MRPWVLLCSLPAGCFHLPVLESQTYACETNDDCVAGYRCSDAQCVEAGGSGSGPGATERGAVEAALEVWTPYGIDWHPEIGDVIVHGGGELEVSGAADHGTTLHVTWRVLDPWDAFDVGAGSDVVLSEGGGWTLFLDGTEHPTDGLYMFEFDAEDVDGKEAEDALAILWDRRPPARPVVTVNEFGLLVRRGDRDTYIEARSPDFPQDEAAISIAGPSDLEDVEIGLAVLNATGLSETLRLEIVLVDLAGHESAPTPVEISPDSAQRSDGGTSREGTEGDRNEMPCSVAWVSQEEVVGNATKAKHSSPAEEPFLAWNCDDESATVTIEVMRTVSEGGPTEPDQGVLKKSGLLFSRDQFIFVPEELGEYTYMVRIYTRGSSHGPYPYALTVEP